MGSKVQDFSKVGVVLAWTWLAPPSQPSSMPACEAKLTVQIPFSAGQNADIASRAKRYVEQVFNWAGIELRWMYCTPSAIRDSAIRSCGDPNSAWTRITVLAKPMVKTERSVFGLTLPSGVVVFSDRIRGFARGYGFFESEVLALVIAHELGHVLLGLHHGSSGVMLAELRPQDVRSFMSGTLRFTQTEAALMQAHLNWRMRRMDEIPVKLHVPEVTSPCSARSAATLF
jgi:hypothetical protein